MYCTSSSDAKPYTILQNFYKSQCVFSITKIFLAAFINGKLITIPLMEELVVKKDFTDIYTRKTPIEYLKEMKRLQYRIPNLTKPLYLSLAKQLYNKLQRPITILDLGSSYGINSALMRHNLTMSELDDFFLQETPPDEKQTREFFKKLPMNAPMRKL